MFNEVCRVASPRLAKLTHYCRIMHNFIVILISIYVSLAVSHVHYPIVAFQLQQEVKV